MDRATLGPGSRPSVHSFSNKQHDFSAWSADDALRQLRVDIREARSKYGGTVEVRRPGHPLFGRKVVVTRVHLVYDGRGLAVKVQETLIREAYSRGVELHFMDLEDWNKEDDFILHLYSPTDPLTRGFEGLEEVLEIVESLDEELRPDRMYLSPRPQKYSRQTLRRRFHENVVGTGTGTILTRSQPPEVSV